MRAAEIVFGATAVSRSSTRVSIDETETKNSRRVFINGGAQGPE
jgi:hypothetical protein